MKTKTRNATQKLVESALMIAFATVLSVLKLAEMPYGGSITIASMLPMVIIAYRHGMGWGLTSGLVYAAIQQLLGLNSLSYVTGWQSVLAVIILDYILAFTVVGFGGAFRGRLGNQSREMAAGAFLVCVLRYVLHTVAGCTVWAGLSIPTEAALIYSLGYNATYMIPETVVVVVVALYLCSIVDFTKQLPTRVKREERVGAGGDMLTAYSTLVALGALVGGIIYDFIAIFPYLQEPEDGSFTFAHLGEVDWMSVIIVSAVCFLIAIGLIIFKKIRGEISEEKYVERD